ncbi:MAG: Zn-ribbon domain-containing OB-fold protein [Candidatus Binatia bacterium]
MAEEKREIRKPLPEITPVTRPFWAAAAEARLLLQRCPDCGRYIWTPRPLCVECGSERLQWTEVSGRGTIYSFTVIRQVAGRGSSKAFEKDIPYVVAWIDLDEGPRMVSNVVGCPVDEVKIAMRVSVVFEPASAEISLPKFRPAVS